MNLCLMELGVLRHKWKPQWLSNTTIHLTHPALLDSHCELLWYISCVCHYLWKQIYILSSCLETNIFFVNMSVNKFIFLQNDGKHSHHKWYFLKQSNFRIAIIELNEWMLTFIYMFYCVPLENSSHVWRHHQLL